MAEGLGQQQTSGRAPQRSRGDSSAGMSEPLRGLHTGTHVQPAAAWQYPALPEPPQLPNGVGHTASEPGSQSAHQHSLQAPQQHHHHHHQQQQETAMVIAQPPPAQQHSAQSLVSQLPPEQRAALARMPPAQQTAALQTLRQRQERQQQGSPPDAQVCALLVMGWSISTCVMRETPAVPAGPQAVTDSARLLSRCAFVSSALRLINSG